MTTTRQAGYGQAASLTMIPKSGIRFSEKIMASRGDREGERFSGAGAFGDGSTDKSRDRPGQGWRGFCAFRP
jgi:hypothetical protein